MGRVFKVLDRQGGSHVALKTLRASTASDRHRFESEVRTLSKLHHKNVVQLFDAGVAGDEIFFTMELLEGVSLDRFLDGAPPGAAAIERLLAIALGVMEALEYIHASGVIHRDVKPSNIMVLGVRGAGPALEGPVPLVKLMDFGLARGLETAARRGQIVSGTPLYMAPEQVSGAASERSDLYSLGATLYHLIARRPPFASLTGALSRRPEPAAPSELNPSCSPGISHAILELMEREPHRRPPSVAEARERLLACLDPDRKGAALPPRLSPPPFTGRRREIESLRSLLARASRGEGGCVQIIGGRRSGKTWLLRHSGIASEALSDFGLNPIRVTFPRGGAIHRGSGELFAELLAVVRSRGGEEGLREALEPWGAALLEALGVEDEGRAALPSGRATRPVSTDDPSHPAARLARERLLEAGARILRRAAAVQPLFLAVEDVQCSDDLELDLLGRLARAVKDLPVALALSYRPEAARESRSFARWISDLEADLTVMSLTLGSLTDGEAKALVEQMLHPKGAVAPELAAFLSERSEGNPSSLTRWVESLWERKALHREDGVWILADRTHAGDPSSGAACLDRLERLDSKEADLLTVAAVLGASFDEETAASMAHGSAEEGDMRLKARLRSLVLRGFLEQDGEEYSLSPDLDETSPARRALEERAGRALLETLHRRAAEVLLERHGSAAEGQLFRIAGHFFEAGERGKAFELYLASARYMARIFANGRALEAYRRALETCASADAARAIHEEAGDLSTRIGDYPAALEHLQTAQPPAGTSPALLDKIGRVLHRQGEFGPALVAFSRCLEGSDVTPATRAQALFRIGGIHLDRGDPAAARGCLEESLEISKGLQDLKLAAEALFSLGVVEKSQDRLDMAVARFEEALRNAEKSGSLHEVATTLNNLGNTYRAIGDDRKAVECFRRSIETRDRIGDRQGLAICLNNLARVHAYRGEIALSRSSTESALKIFEEVGDKKGVLIAMCNLGEALHQLGELRRARDLHRASLEMAERLKAQRLLESVLCNLGALELDAGEYAAAGGHLRRCLKTLPEDKPLELRAQALGLLASVCMRVHDLEGAEDALREAMDIAKELKVKEKLGALVSQQVRFHLERGEPEQAVETGRQTMAQEDGMDQMGRALLHHELGRAYRELGPDWADHTEKELNTALRAFESMGSRHNAAAARADLAVYWRLLGEEGEADALFRRAEEDLRRIGAQRRIEELSSLRGSPA